MDSRYTTTTQLVKLVSSHTISRIFLRIGDLKRSKMVRTVNVYYNNRTVQSVVELKNRPCEYRCRRRRGPSRCRWSVPAQGERRQCTGR